MVVNKNSGALKLVGTIFTGVGLILLLIGGWICNRQYTIMKSWPLVEATVTQSRVAHYLDSRGSSMYRTEMQFRYTVGGQTFDTPSSPGYSTSDYPAMKRIADAYARGTRHLIRYNPADPNDIRMNAGYNFGFFFVPILLGGMGVFFAGFGLVFRVASGSVQLLLCPACGQAIEPGQRFCPNCASPLRTAA